MATSCIRTAARDAAGPVRSLASSSALHSGGDRQHARTRDAQLHRAPKIASRVSLQVHAWSKHLTWPENSGDRGEKKLCELPAWSAGARGCSPPASEQPSAEARPAARGVRAPRSPAVRANLGAHRGHGRALTWHSLLSVQVVAVFTWVFKQVSGRENEGGKKRKRERKRKKKRSNYANGLRTGRRASGLTPLLYEFSEQPRAGQIYGGASRLRQVPPPEHLEVN